MKLIFSRKVHEDFSQLKQSEEFLGLVTEICDTFDPAMKPILLEGLQQKQEFVPIKRKNWSLYIVDDAYVLDVNDELFTILMDSMKAQWSLATTLVKPVKAIMDLVMAFAGRFKHISQRVDEFIYAE